MAPKAAEKAPAKKAAPAKSAEGKKKKKAAKVAKAAAAAGGKKKSKGRRTEVSTRERTTIERLGSVVECASRVVPRRACRSRPPSILAELLQLHLQGAEAGAPW